MITLLLILLAYFGLHAQDANAWILPLQGSSLHPAKQNNLSVSSSSLYLKSHYTNNNDGDEYSNESFADAFDDGQQQRRQHDITNNKNNLLRSISRRGILKSSSALAATIAAALASANGFGPPISPANALENSENARIAIFEQVAPSVVFIDTFTERRDAFSTNVMEVPLGSGSGFVWDKEGHIVTNFHVVRNAQSAQVAILTNEKAKLLPAAAPGGTKTTVPKNTDDSQPNKITSSKISGALISPYTSLRSSRNGAGNSAGAGMTFFKAVVVGVDPGKDIAVLKLVDAPPEILQPIPIGTSQGLKVGQQALAIGNPFGLDHTLTAGIISGLGRQVKSPIGRPISNVIQSDASINPGNSGGPLLDSSGKVIGINTAIYSTSGASAGIGFAIPIDTVTFIVETLLRDGQVIRPVLGITFLESKQARAALGITSGVLVLQVPEGSPAARAGMRGTRRSEDGLIELGDIITKVNDVEISTESDLFQALEGLQVGDTVNVTVNRMTVVQEQLAVQEVKLQITLQASTAVEKSMQLYQYPMPATPSVPSVPSR